MEGSSVMDETSSSVLSGDETPLFFPDRILYVLCMDERLLLGTEEETMKPLYSARSD